MMNEYVIIAESENRLDKFVSENIDELTRTSAVALIESGNCTVNGNVAVKKHCVKIGDVVKLFVPESEPLDVLAEDIPLDVRYEDEHVAVINKPKGMVVHPSAGHTNGTLVNALMWRYANSASNVFSQSLSDQNVSNIIRPGIVHRIDKDTSGLIAIAKNDLAHLSLSEQLKNRTMTREYEAVVHGRVKPESNTVNAPIGRSVSDRKKMCVTTKNAREAITYYETITQYDEFTHLRLRLHTGRTHQIRVHMAHIGYPVAGDTVYGGSRSSKKPLLLNGQCLHAKKLRFAHPVTGECIEIESELPNYFAKFIQQLRGLNE